MDMWFADSETFIHDQLWVFKRQTDGRTEVYWNDNAGVAAFIDTFNPVLCGYNFRDYDSQILKATLLDWSPEDINNLSQTIVREKDRRIAWTLFNGYPWVDLPPIIDLFHDVVPKKSLKEIEGNIGMAIEESSVPFDIDRALTPTERAEVLHYCIHDVNATKRLYDLRFDYVKAKSDLCELQGVEPLTMLKHTNARVVSEVLGAIKLAHIPYEEYTIPDNIDQSAIPQEVIDYVLAVNTDNCLDKDKTKLEFMFHGCPTTVGLGGIHAAVPSYKETASDERVILIQDIGSFYPSLIINNGYMSRAVADHSLYKTFYDLRMKAKGDGDKATAEAAKLVLNITYGTLKEPFNQMYDPMQGTRVCLSGQLYVIDLIEQMYRSVPSLQLVQLNTDGWVISCNRDEQMRALAAVTGWSERTGFTVDTDEVQCIVQANVNNYVLRTVNNTIKAKGGVVAKHEGGDFKSNSATIIDEAIVKWLLDTKPIDFTIQNCDDLERFQIIAKAGRTFKKVMHGDKEVQRVNRLYATTDTNAAGIVKVKMDNGVETGRSKIPLTPDHCVIDNDNSLRDSGNLLTQLDKSWYIALAEKKAHDFVTRDKKEKEQMATETEQANELTQPEEKPKPTRKPKASEKEAGVTPPTPVPFKEKLLALQTGMGEMAGTVQFDGVLSFGNNSSDYADTQQYKVRLGALCSSLRLLFQTNMTQNFLGVITPEKSTTPSYGAQVDGFVTISDVDSDAYEEYNITGFGANVSPGYCVGVAQTNALRNFILNNYLLDNKGRDGDDQMMNQAVTMTQGGKGYVAPAEKAAIKENIADSKAEEAKYATDMFASALYDKILEAQKVKPKFGAKMVAEHFEEDGTPKTANGKSTMLKKDAVAGLTKAEEIIAGAAE